MSLFTVATLRADTLPGISEALDPFIRSHEIAGAVTIVVTPDRVVHLAAQGLADVETNAPMREDAVFWIASMSKPVTAVAVMMLVEQGKLALDDPASKYLPELGQMKNADGSPAKTITIRHLLTHTSGLPENTKEETLAAHTLEELVSTFATKPMAFEPGTRWSYCQTGINSLGRIVELLSHQRYETFLDERIFKPLGMRDTTFFPSADLQQRLAHSYRLDDGKLSVTDIFPFHGRDLADTNRVPLANGGLFSTASDYGRFTQMLLNDGTLDGHRYLSAASVEQMRTIQTTGLETGFIPGNAWGLGVCIVREPGGISAALSPGSYGHGGAYGTQAWIDPTKKVAYVLMVQRANFPNSDASEVRKAFQDAALAAFKR